MKRLDKLALGAVIIIMVTNPASSQFIMDSIEWLFKQIFMYGSPLNFAASGVVVAYILFKMWDGRTKTIVPAKTKKTTKHGMSYETL